MNQKLTAYIDATFARYGSDPAVAEIKEELSHDLQERFTELRAQGRNDDEAFAATVDSIGDISEIVQGRAGEGLPASARTVNLSQRNLPGADFAGADIHDGRFSGSALKGANFAGANLTSSVFKGSDLSAAIFDGANLTSAKLTHSALQGASFTGSMLTDTDFNSSDLRSVSFAGQTLVGVSFDKAGLKGASFKNAVLRGVSFNTTVKHAIFTGAAIDKVTYAALQGNGADLSQATKL